MIPFALAALLLIMLPGPDQALITRNALVGGRRGGLATIAGGALGVAVHSTSAALGLSALMLASSQAFLVLKIVGAGYLVWLAIQMFRTASRPAPGPAAAGPSSLRSGWTHLRQGFLSNALNPKVALFFVTFLPQFLSAGSPRSQVLLFSAVFLALYLGWFGLYLAAVDRLAGWLQRPRIKARIERVSGALLVGVAARLAAATH